MLNDGQLMLIVSTHGQFMVDDDNGNVSHGVGTMVPLVAFLGSGCTGCSRLWR